MEGRVGYVLTYSCRDVFVSNNQPSVCPSFPFRSLNLFVICQSFQFLFWRCLPHPDCISVKFYDHHSEKGDAVKDKHLQYHTFTSSWRNVLKDSVVSLLLGNTKNCKSKLSDLNVCLSGATTIVCYFFESYRPWSMVANNANI